MYLIESSIPKRPEQNLLGTRQSLWNAQSEGWGHIARNINAALALSESARPEISIEGATFAEYDLVVRWKLLGCNTVDWTQLYVRENPDK
jgi:hypothetical protein